MLLSRRRFLALLPPSIGALFLFACSDDDSETTTPAATQASSAAGGIELAATGIPNEQLAPTPACGDDDDPTPAQTEGPYFTPNSPERTSFLEAGAAGTRLVLEGFVLSTSCRPVERALVDFWQCDNAGNYDNTSFRLRGHQFTDASGRFRLETIVPGLYPGRTRHIHVKVQAPNRPALTTQLYFPDEAGNRSDSIFSTDLVLENYRDASGGKSASFNFVVNA